VLGNLSGGIFGSCKWWDVLIMTVLCVELWTSFFTFYLCFGALRLDLVWRNCDCDSFWGDLVRLTNVQIQEQNKHLQWSSPDIDSSLMLNSEMASRKKKKTWGPICIIHYQQTEQTVKYNRSLRVTSRKLIRQLKSKKHKAMKVKGWMTFVGRYQLSTYQICMGITHGVTRTLWTTAKLWNSPSEGGDVSSLKKREQQIR